MSIPCAFVDDRSSSPNPEPAVAGEKGEMMVVPVLPHVLDGVSSIRVYLHKVPLPPLLRGWVCAGARGRVRAGLWLCA